MLITLRTRVEVLATGSIHVSFHSLGAPPGAVLCNATGTPLKWRFSGGQSWLRLDAFSCTALSYMFKQQQQPGRLSIDLQDGLDPSQSARTFVLEASSESLQTAATEAAALATLPASVLSSCLGASNRLGRLGMHSTPRFALVSMGADGAGPYLGGADVAAVEAARVSKVVRVLPASLGPVKSAKGPQGAMEDAGGALLEAGAVALSSRRRLQVVFTVPLVEMSLIDQVPRELLLFTMDQLSVEAASGLGHKNASTLRVSVRDIQVDDMRPFTKFPVVFGKARDGKRIDASCSSRLCSNAKHFVPPPLSPWLSSPPTLAKDPLGLLDDLHFWESFPWDSSSVEQQDWKRSHQLPAWQPFLQLCLTRCDGTGSQGAYQNVPSMTAMANGRVLLGEALGLVVGAGLTTARGSLRSPHRRSTAPDALPW